MMLKEKHCIVKKKKSQAELFMSVFFFWAHLFQQIGAEAFSVVETLF